MHGIRPTQSTRRRVSATTSNAVARSPISLSRSNTVCNRELMLHRVAFKNLRSTLSNVQSRVDLGEFQGWAQKTSYARGAHRVERACTLLRRTRRTRYFS